MKQIQVGSRVFFSGFEDFHPSDSDFVEFHDDAEVDFWVTYENQIHTFHYKTMTKEEFINFELEHCQEMPVAASKFIVPELVEYFGITFVDLIPFMTAFDNLRGKHKYVKYILDCYLDNGWFELTEEQLLYAYDIYKQKDKK